MQLLTGFFLALFLHLPSDNPTTDVAVSSSIRESLRHGDAHQLSTRFARSIQLIIETERVNHGSIPAAQAEQLLRTFFRRYPPQRFQFIYQGSAERLRYSTGTYETNGQSFAVYVFMRQTDDQQFVINALHVKRN